MNIIFDKNQQDILLHLPICFRYKNKIKRFCKKYNISVQCFLEYVLGAYFGDIPVSLLEFISDLGF